MNFKRICFLLTITMGSPVFAAGLEVGLGGVVTQVPHYIGSDEAETFVVPFPYLRYRSEKLTIDRNAIQGNLWSSGNWSLELSFGGSVEVESEKSEARQGMDDIDYILESGPALHYYFSGDRTTENAIYLELPFRVATTTDFTNLGFAGYSFNPQVVWKRGYSINDYTIRPQVSAGLRSASDQYHDYFYGVESQFVTANRSEYSGKTGYGGMQIGYSTEILWDNWLTAGFIRYVNAGSSAFEDSPLFKQSSNLVVGFAVAYLFADE